MRGQPPVPVGAQRAGLPMGSLEASGEASEMALPPSARVRVPGEAWNWTLVTLAGPLDAGRSDPGRDEARREGGARGRAGRAS